MATTTAYPPQTAAPAHTPEAYVPYTYAAPAAVHPHHATLPPTGIPAVAHYAPAPVAPVMHADPQAYGQVAAVAVTPKPRRLRKFLIWTASLSIVAAAIAGVWMNRPDGGPHVVNNETHAISEAAPTTAPPETAPPTTAKPTTTTKPTTKPTTTTPKSSTTVTKPATSTPKR